MRCLGPSKSYGLDAALRDVDHAGIVRALPLREASPLAFRVARPAHSAGLLLSPSHTSTSTLTSTSCHSHTHPWQPLPEVPHLSLAGPALVTLLVFIDWLTSSSCPGRNDRLTDHRTRPSRAHHAARFIPTHIPSNQPDTLLACPHETFSSLARHKLFRTNITFLSRAHTICDYDRDCLGVC